MIVELAAVIFVALGAAKLASLLGMQLLGDGREAARQASIKRLNAQKRRYLPSVSAVIFPAPEAKVLDVLDALRENDYKLKEIIIIANPKSAVAKEVHHYRRTQRVSRMVSVRHHSAQYPYKILGAKPKGQIILLLDGTSLPGRHAISSGIMPFRDKTVGAVMPYVVSTVHTSLISGLRAARHIVSLHFRRARNPKQTDVYGALFIRTTVFTRITRKDSTLSSLRDTMDVVQDMGAQYRLVRHTDSIVQSELVRLFPVFSFGALLWWALDVAALWGVYYYFGRYEGIAVIGFTAIFAWILGAIAVFVAKGVSTGNKINLFLLLPFTYIFTQLCAPLGWVQGQLRK